ncbi:MAG: hypothetical protein HY013_21440 [Candidatus Solibacter usitatus]|nr:hypothetical protein [Candidatus Solibacter usitatus]
MTEKLERLAAAGIQLLPAEMQSHYVFERDGFVSLVERAAGGFGAIGTPAKLTGRGLALLVWRGERAFFVSKGFEEEADDGEVAALRRFLSDLEQALE